MHTKPGAAYYPKAPSQVKKKSVNWKANGARS